MKLLQSTNDPTKYAKVDDDVYNVIQEIGLKFYVMNKCHGIGHFMSTTKIQLPGMEKKRHLLLHRFVWLLKTGEEPTRTVDHIDRDTLNNQFENLRLATRQEQQQHRGKRKDNTSGFIGVNHQHKVNNYVTYYDYWRAAIKNPDGKIEAKCFPFTDDGKITAAHWYDSKAIEYFGEFHGQLNFPNDDQKTA